MTHQSPATPQYPYHQQPNTQYGNAMYQYPYPVQGTPQNTPQNKFVLSFIAIVLSALGTLFLFTPLAWVSLIFAVPAVALAIIALVRKDNGKVLAFMALGISAASLIAGSAVTSLALFQNNPTSSDGVPGEVPGASGDIGISDLENLPDLPPPAELPWSPGQGTGDGTTDPGTVPNPPSSQHPGGNTGQGMSLTDPDGVTYSVTQVQCGIGPVQGYLTEVTPEGEFCRVDLTIQNQSTENLGYINGSIKLIIDGFGYDFNTVTSSLGGDLILFYDLFPNTSVNGTIYFDVPTGSQPDQLRILPAFVFDKEELFIDLK